MFLIFAAVIVLGCSVKIWYEPTNLIFSINEFPDNWSMIRSSELNASTEVSSKAIANGWTNGYAQKFASSKLFIDYMISFYDNSVYPKTTNVIPNPEEIEFGSMLTSLPPTNVTVREIPINKIGDDSISYEVNATYDYAEDFGIYFYFIEFAKGNVHEMLVMVSYGNSSDLNQSLLYDLAVKAEAKIK